MNTDETAIANVYQERKRKKEKNPPTKTNKLTHTRHIH